MTPNCLMEKTSNKYTILKNKEIWKAPSAEEEKGISIEAHFSELKKRVASKKRSVN